MVVTGALLGLFVVSGCRQAPDEMESPVAVPAGFSESGGAMVPDAWWTAFGSPELDGLIEEALEGNLDLGVAWERLRAARAVREQAGAGLWPTLDIEGQGQLRRPEFMDGDQLQLGLSAGYEVDLWGRIRSRTAAEDFRVEATRADYEAAALSVSAEVARTWFGLVVARRQEALLESQVETNETVLRLLRNRFGSGQILRTDILQQTRLVEQTREQLYAAQARSRVLEHQLEVLLGRVPQEGIGLSVEALPGLPPLPETGLPAELVRRRPDMRAAWNRLMAADRDLAAAVAERYPRVTLSGSLFTEENDAINLFDEWIRSLVGNVVLPVIDGGRRRAVAEEAEAVRMQLLNAYGQTMLEAFREVEDALVREDRQRRQLESLEEQLRLARETYEQLRRQYFNGVTDYLEVLTALTDEQRLRRDTLSAQLALYEFRIALYRALAGGTAVARAPNPSG